MQFVSINALALPTLFWVSGRFDNLLFWCLIDHHENDHNARHHDSFELLLLPHCM